MPPTADMKVTGGGHGGPGKGIGITMALLGVMLAFCAAMVGSARTDLIKATVEQSNKWSIYQSESTKFRIMESDVEMLRALTPSKAELKKFEDRLATVKRPGGKSDDEDTTELKEAIHVATTELADVLTPIRKTRIASRPSAPRTSATWPRLARMPRRTTASSRRTTSRPSGSSAPSSAPRSASSSRPSRS